MCFVTVKVAKITNTLRVHGFLYATLDNADPAATAVSNAGGCNASYYILPPRWELAPAAAHMYWPKSDGTAIATLGMELEKMCGRQPIRAHGRRGTARRTDGARRASSSRTAARCQLTTRAARRQWNSTVLLSREDGTKAFHRSPQPAQLSGRTAWCVLARQVAAKQVFSRGDPSSLVRGMQSAARAPAANALACIDSIPLF